MWTSPSPSRSPWLPAAQGLIASLAVLMMAALAQAGPPDVEKLTARDPASLVEVTNGSIEKADAPGEPTWRWRINTGQSSDLSLKRDHEVFARLRNYDRLRLEFRIVSGEIEAMGLRALGHVTGPRQHKIHQWNLAFQTTPRGVWHTRDIDLQRPFWFPWDNPDGEGREGHFIFDATAAGPDTVIEIRRAALVRSAVMLKPFYDVPITWPIKTQNPDGSVTYALSFQVLNTSGGPTEIAAKILSEHQRFRVAFEAASLPAKNAALVTFLLKATMNKEEIAATPELYSEPLRVEFAPAALPDAGVRFETPLVRPLNPGARRQVIVPQADVTLVREKLAAGDAELQKLVGSKAMLARADAFVEKDLRQLPPGHPWPGSNPGPDWEVGKAMPEIINRKTGERECGTALSGLVWKRHLEYPGANAENLGMAYLLTGDEKYARKAIELFSLYARQYSELRWNVPIELPWLMGAPIETSSRIASSSGYGSNILMRGQCRLLSMIADSPSWTPEQRAAVYQGFVLPYAAELAKGNGGINNQTDISNHNLVLLGLVFDDAHMLHRGVMSDAGVLPRIKDIDAQGFSSEGRPLNYHFSGMVEYLPAAVYLDAAGVKLDIDRSRLLAAMRMPYQRALLTGQVPTMGDCGRGHFAGNQPLAAHLIPMFPQEAWLTDVGAGGTLTAKLRAYQAGTKPDPEGYKKLIPTDPFLFKEAGLAILRSGKTADEQVMATLDYGRAYYHVGSNRNQITLSAFGALFSHDPGSLYNLGTSVRPGPDPKLNAFALNHSPGFNVIVVDAQNQQRAIGKLLAWSPGPERQVAVSRIDGVYPGVSHTRALVLTRGVVVLLDRVAADREHTYDFFYHNLGTLRLGEGWAGTPRDKPLARTLNYESILNLQQLAGQGPLRLHWDMTSQFPASAPATQPAGAGLDLWHLPIKGGEIFTGTTGMNNGNSRTGLTPDAAPSLIHRVHAKDVEFVTVLEPHKGTAKVKAITGAAGPGGAAGAGGVAVTFSDGSSLTLSIDQLIREANAANTPPRPSP